MPLISSSNFLGDSKHWFTRMGHLTLDQIDLLDEKFRNKWRALLSVDDMVKEVVQELDEQVS